MHKIKEFNVPLCLFLGIASAGAAQDQVQSPTTSKDQQIMPKEFLASLVGTWEGTCRTWFEPGKLADESGVTGQFQPMLDGQMVRHTYEGAIKGKPRHGEEIIAFNAASKRFQTSWVDSFHMNYGLLFAEGEPTKTGFSVSGKYDVGEGIPPWGWKTVFELTGEDQLTMTAYNVSPEGEEAKAVETTYRRMTSGPPESHP